MSQDLRLDVSFRDNLKRKRLQQKLGAKGVLALIDLWLYSVENFQKGEIKLIKSEEIAILSNFKGNQKKLKIFTDTLIEIGFLEHSCEGETEIYYLHNWGKRQPWIYHYEERSEIARKNAYARWNANGMQSACKQHAKSNAHILSLHNTTKREGTKHPAIVAFREIFHKFPNKTQIDEIINIMSKNENLSNWTCCLKQWALHGYKPTNIKGMLDWYTNGIPEKQKGLDKKFSEDRAAEADKYKREIEETAEALKNLGGNTRERET